MHVQEHTAVLMLQAAMSLIVLLVVNGKSLQDPLHVYKNSKVILLGSAGIFDYQSVKLAIKTECHTKCAKQSF